MLEQISIREGVGQPGGLDRIGRDEGDLEQIGQAGPLDFQMAPHPVDDRLVLPLGEDAVRRRRDRRRRAAEVQNRLQQARRAKAGVEFGILIELLLVGDLFREGARVQHQGFGVDGGGVGGQARHHLVGVDHLFLLGVDHHIRDARVSRRLQEGVDHHRGEDEAADAQDQRQPATEISDEPVIVDGPRRRGLIDLVRTRKRFGDGAIHTDIFRVRERATGARLYLELQRKGSGCPVVGIIVRPRRP